MEPLIFAVLQPKTWWQRGVLILAATAFISICAQISIELSFTSVPITGQSFAVLVVAALCGVNIGVVSVALYILLGGLGLPVFAGATGGLEKITGATGGFLIAFVVAAYVVAKMFYLGKISWAKTAVVFLLGTLIILVLGMLRLSMFVGMHQALSLGVFPFILGAIAKILLATMVVMILQRFIAVNQKT